MLPRRPRTLKPVLVLVDDEAWSCPEVVQALRCDGLNVFGVSDPVEAVQLLTSVSDSQAVVVSVLSMGLRSAESNCVVAFLRSHVDQFEIVVITARAATALCGEAQSLAAHTLYRPFDLDTLNSLVRLAMLQ